MLKSTTRLTPKFVAASLLTASLAVAPMSASAKCSGGSCGGPSAMEVIAKLVKSAADASDSTSLENAYGSIETIVGTAEKKNVDRTRQVQKWVGELLTKFQQRADTELDAAKASYADGEFAKAVAEYERLAKFEGIPAAAEASKELGLEADRVAWRSARDHARKLVGNQSHQQAATAITELNRLAKAADFRKQNKDLMAELSKQMLGHVEQAQKALNNKQYDKAYATLVEVSRISSARESAAAARRALTQNSSLPGMREARAEYESQRAFSKAKTAFAAIKNPSPKEQQGFQMQLDQVVARFPGTRAAEQAAAILKKNQPTQQASR